MNKFERELGRAVAPYGYRVRKQKTGKRHLIVINDETGHWLTAPLSPRIAGSSITKTIAGIKRYGGKR